MKKRHLKKKLLKAIKELNDEVCKDFGFEAISDKAIRETYKTLKNSKEDIRITLRDYEKLKSGKGFYLTGRG